MKTNKYDKDFDVEQKADELLAALGYELGESRAAYMERLLREAETELDAEPEGVPAEPMHKTRKGGRRILKRTLILAAVLIIVMGTLVVTCEGVRLKLSSLFFRDTPGSTRMIDDENLVVNVAEVVVDYVPEGYELESDEIVGDFNRVLFYSNGEKEVIVSITKTEMYAFNVDNERMEGEAVKINDKEGHLFVTEGKHIVVWQMADCTFQITTTLNETEAIEIARHIYIQ